jgi:exodeoxyribonuclease VII small subunit
MSDLSFEEALKQLDAILESLNDDNLTLEQAIQYYEEGIRLHQCCEALLNEASNRFTEINESLKS